MGGGMAVDGAARAERPRGEAGRGRAGARCYGSRPGPSHVHVTGATGGLGGAPGDRGRASGRGATRSTTLAGPDPLHRPRDGCRPGRRAGGAQGVGTSVPGGVTAGTGSTSWTSTGVASLARETRPAGKMPTPMVTATLMTRASPAATGIGMVRGSGASSARHVHRHDDPQVQERGDHRGEHGDDGQRVASRRRRRRRSRRTWRRSPTVSGTPAWASRNRVKANASSGPVADRPR